jgi:hypothetical protein
MRRFLARLFFAAFVFVPAQALAQSPFDGTWVMNSDTVQQPNKTQTLILDKGMFCCVLSQKSITADGQDHQLPAYAGADTASARVIDANTVEVVAKKADRAMFTTTYTVSQNGEGLTEVFNDTAESEAVTTETLYHRVKRGSPDSHAISGLWRAYQTKKSRNGSIVKYKCTAQGFSAETPLGEKYYGKFDGQFYPTVDDPYHTMASVRLINSNTVEMTQKRERRIIGVMRLTVAPDGKTLNVLYRSKLNNSSTSYEMQKQQ